VDCALWARQPSPHPNHAAKPPITQPNPKPRDPKSRPSGTRCGQDRVRGPEIPPWFRLCTWIAFFFPGVALGLEWMGRRGMTVGVHDAPVVRLRAALIAMVAMALPLSYQYGAIFQKTNSWGGPIKYVFGVDSAGQRRHQAAERLVKHLPPRAKVSGSGFTTPFISNRPDAYNMTLGIFDADYIFFPSEAGDFIVDERATVTRLLNNGEFGVVAIEPPFALAKRGHPGDLNNRLFARW
jgi:hypothetical protein